EDGIRDLHVTGVQTCALPIWHGPALLASSVLDVQLGAAVLRTAFRIVRTIRVGVRRDRTALAVAVRAHQARGVDAVGGQVVVHRAGTALRQALVVGVGAEIGRAHV